MEKTLVDAMGMQCPIPVVKALKAIETMAGPGLLEVHVDNEVAVQNLLRMAAGKHYEARSEQLEPKHFAITIDVNALPEAGVTAEEESACLPDLRGNWVAAVGTRTMGSGNDELGAILMKGFLYAMSQQKELPRTVLFYNGGAYLTTEGSASLEDLKTMQAQGVEILTCGTCLDFYGLKEKLAVGGVTNMYTIVEKLAEASKIIKP